MTPVAGLREGYARVSSRLIGDRVLIAADRARLLGYFRHRSRSARDRSRERTVTGREPLSW
jgi:hypothetical protein